MLNISIRRCAESFPGVPFVVSLLLLATTTSSADAAAIISFSPSSSTITIPVSGTEQFTINVQLAASSGTQSVSGYGLPIDLAPDNARENPPTGWSVTSVVGVFDFPEGAAFLGNANPGEGDVYGQQDDGGTPETFTVTATTLFSFTVEIDNTAVAGNYTASVIEDGALFALTSSGTTSIPTNDITFNTATITLQNVPEPGSLALLGLASLGAAAGAYRRRRKPTSR